MGATILVVDDEPLILNIITKVLESEGHKVLSTTDPESAIQLITGLAKIDLVILDVTMPELNGFELARETHKNCPGTKVIYMSGHAEEVLEIHDADGFIPKPSSIDFIVEEVTRVLQLAK